MKRQYFAIIDTETTNDDKVLDFAMVICDRKQRVYHQCAVIIAENYNLDNLWTKQSEQGHFNPANLTRRIKRYNDMLEQGSRIIRSVNVVNKFINRCIERYNPVLTAYNLIFDQGKCANTGIVLDNFANRFCLWHSAASIIGHNKQYLKFVLENHLFNNPTEKGNMTYKTNAEVVAGFINGRYIKEPHTALEDILEFELPILGHITSKKKWLEKTVSYNWKNFQVRDYFHA